MGLALLEREGLWIPMEVRDSKEEGRGSEDGGCLVVFAASGSSAVSLS